MYNEFITKKLRRFEPSGFHLDVDQTYLFDFQKALVKWSARIGKAALFADTGLGKTRMQLAWADAVAKRTGGNVLILAPLAVAGQTCDEGKDIGIDVRHIREGSIEGVCITNYERVHKFDCSELAGVILDESSILKHHSSKSFVRLTEMFRDTPYKLCATATPAPNDYTEFGTHAEFLGVCTRAEMLSEFFVHDGGETQTWRLKGHARDEFWKWVSSWAAVVRDPSDLGFDGSRYILPPIKAYHYVVQTEKEPESGKLFELEAQTLSERRSARRRSIMERVIVCADLVNSIDDYFVVWCDLNAESEALVKAIPGAVEVRGSQTIDEKESILESFRKGEIRVLVTKPSIAGWGCNWQHCHNMAFVGVTDSYEQYYQSVRRCYRFGQKNPVNVYVFSSDLEGSVVSNLTRKDEDANKMWKEMVPFTRQSVIDDAAVAERFTNLYNPNIDMRLPEWIQ